MTAILPRTRDRVLVAEAGGRVVGWIHVAETVTRHLASPTSEELRARQKAADLAIEKMGITFTVYGEGTNIDRAWPFDIIPRIIAAIVKDGVFPEELLRGSKNFRPQCMGIRPPFGAWAHSCGSD